MSRNRPGPTARLGTALATAVLRGAPQGEAEALAKRFLEREAEIAKRREQERRGTQALNTFRRAEARR